MKSSVLEVMLLCFLFPAAHRPHQGAVRVSGGGRTRHGRYRSARLPVRGDIRQDVLISTALHSQYKLLFVLVPQY